MKKADIVQNLNQLDSFPNLTFKWYKSPINFGFILRSPCDLKGVDVQFSHYGLKITKFLIEPYKTFDIMTGYEKLTLKQRDFISDALLTKYFDNIH
jgi:hypothetical protein